MNAVLRPAKYIQRLLAAEPLVREIELSAYTNVPQSLYDVRKSCRLRTQDVSRRFAELSASLSAEQEIAFHSRVHVQGPEGKLRVRHLPLLDFKTGEQALAEAAAECLVTEYRAPNAAFFASGHSYHLYLNVLLSEKQWTRFMGRVLLFNPREGEAIVDARWIGHRLMEGFGALRWSSNGGAYSAPPTLVRQWGTV